MTNSLPARHSLLLRIIPDRQRVAEIAIFIAFAAILPFFLFTHAMYLDEALAWQIARHSHGLFDLASNLRYEGHPLLWYLLLYLPAHLSSHMVWMQVLNYCIAIIMAALITFERRLPLAVRPALLFSAAIFFYMGVVSRSYMLAGALLIAAARCFLSKSDRHWLAIGLLALAINTHALAIPIAAAIFIWLYWLRKNRGPAKWGDARFWKSVGILFIALVICYLTIRPAPDLATPEYDNVGFDPVRFLVLGIGSIWHFFVYLPPAFLASPAAGILNQPSMIDPMLTFLLFLLAILALPARSGQAFMFLAVLLWTAVVWATVHAPTGFHQTFLFVAFIIALMHRPEEEARQPILPPRAARSLLVVLLGCQLLLCWNFCARERRMPFSASKAVAEWIRKNSLLNHPLVFTPDSDAPAVLGYTGIDSGYSPTCRCRGSFVVFGRARNPFRQVNGTELDTLQAEFGSSPVLISFFRLSDQELQSLGLTLAYTPPPGTWAGENSFVYIRTKNLVIPTP